MASRCRPISRPVLSLLHSVAIKTKPSTNTLSAPFFRIQRGLGFLESMLPLHSALSSARLTSRLGIDSATASRSLSQECGLSIPR